MNHRNEGEKLISIIIATYNAGAYIEECLLSIFSQQHKHIEVIIADACSTDDTLEIIARNNPGNISCVSEKDEGIYDAFNKAIKRAKGEWIYFLGADDRLLKGFSEMVSQMHEPKTLYYGNSEGFYSGQKPDFVIYTGRFNSYRLAKYCLNHQAILYPSAAFAKYSYDLRYKVFADYALNINLWGDPEFKKTHVPISIVQYHMGGFSSIAKDPVFKEDKPYLIKKYLGTLVYWRYLYKKYKKKIFGEEDWY